jgi:hypothetical protein
MQTLPMPLQLTLPPEKRRSSGVAIATIAYAAFLLASKLLWPSAHERSETLLHLLGEAAFQTILFAVFFTFLRLVLPRNRQNIGPIVDENSTILEIRPNPSVQVREDLAPKHESGLRAQSSR